MSRRVFSDVLFGVGGLFLLVYLFDIVMGYEEYGAYFGVARIGLAVFGVICLLILWIWMIMIYFKSPPKTFSVGWLILLIVLFYIGSLIFYIARGRKYISDN